MTLKSRLTTRVLYAILVWCVFSFKMILIGVGESGIRADDFLILLAFVLLVLRGDLRKVKRSRPFNIYLAFVAANLLSALWSSDAGRVTPLVSFFSVVRLIQYMVFYYLGYMVARNGSKISGMLSIYLIVLCAAVPLQMIGVVPVPGAFNGITSRAVGNTNGPYEMAAVAAFLLCYLGYRQRSWVKGTSSLFLVLLSASRITFIATALSLVKIMLTRPRSRRGLVLGVATLAVIGVIGFVTAPQISNDASNGREGVLARISTAASTGISLDTVTSAYNEVPTYRTAADYFQGEFNESGGQAMEGGGDVSGLTRVLRWTTLIKSALNGLDTILIGLGPSFGSLAVDGYFVRVFVETGVIGLALFMWFAKSLLADSAGSSWAFREYVFIMLGTACFIDIFVSYKPMLLLWFWHGMNQFKSKGAIFENRLPNEG
jgi:hypothetical protein